MAKKAKTQDALAQQEQQQAGHASTKQHRSKAPAAIGLIIIIALLGAIIYWFAFMNGNNSQNSKYLPTNHTNNQLYGVLSSNGTGSTTELSQLISQRIHNSSTFGVNYTGKISLNGKGLENYLEGFLPTIPFTLGYMKYHNDSRVTFATRGIPLFGNLSVVLISIENYKLTYSCLNATSKLISGSNHSSVHGYQCYNLTKATNFNQTLNQTFNMTNSTFMANGGGASPFNFSTIPSVSNSMRLTLSKPVPAVYGNMPCYFVTGTGQVNITAMRSINGSYSGKPMAFNVSACFSTNYDVPLNATATMGLGVANQSVSIEMHETSIGGSVSDSQVTSLPGPIENMSSSFNSTQ
ncbi:MAG: hypothetical protein M1504_00030 [Candidatus Marsarchaeota archaeon]|nr:hypothetical protein [Candidatus Marsarchaeota archaeon]